MNYSSSISRDGILSNTLEKIILLSAAKIKLAKITLQTVVQSIFIETNVRKNGVTKSIA